MIKIKRFLQNNMMLVALVLILLVEKILDFLNAGVPLSQAVTSWFLGELLILPAIVIGLSFHEFAHAKVAELCGDPTPGSYGRVTINPRAHFDPMGFAALLFLGFGWGIPVPINPNHFKNRRRDEIAVGLAGVTTNLVIACIFAGLIKVIETVSPGFLVQDFGHIVGYVLMQVVWINLILMAFNLIPVPPLDGFNVAAQVFRFREKPIYYEIYQKGMLFLMILVIFNLPGKLIVKPLIYFADFLFSTILGLPGWSYLMMSPF